MTPHVRPLPHRGAGRTWGAPVVCCFGVGASLTPNDTATARNTKIGQGGVWPILPVPKSPPLATSAVAFSSEACRPLMGAT